jgi:hypothetical protein
MHLTEAWLRQYSSAPSFERGERYHDQGRVHQLVRVAEVYRAEVDGSQRYRQFVDLSGERPALTCTCPYAGSGYCKHLVAVGLAILAGEYEDQSLAEVSASQPAAPIDLARLGQAWESLTDPLKLHFLSQALVKQPGLAGVFLRYAEGQVPPELHIDRYQVQRDLTKRLQTIDLDQWPLVEDDPASAEAHQEQVIQAQLDQALAQATQPLQTLLATHDWPNALVLLLGCYEGIETARIARLDTWEPWMDVLQTAFQERYHRLLDALAHEIIAPRRAIWALQMWFARWQHHEQHVSLNHPTHSVQYHLADWCTLFQVLTQDRGTAQFLRTRLDAYQLQGESAAQLYAHLDRIDRAG